MITLPLKIDVMSATTYTQDSPGGNLSTFITTGDLAADGTYLHKLLDDYISPASIVNQTPVLYLG